MKFEVLDNKHADDGKVVKRGESFETLHNIRAQYPNRFRLLPDDAVVTYPLTESATAPEVPAQTVAEETPSEAAPVPSETQVPTEPSHDDE